MITPVHLEVGHHGMNGRHVMLLAMVASKPEYAELTCDEGELESGRCNENPCPVDDKWGPWNNWFSCDVTCGGGHRTRTKDCIGPTPTNGGLNCPGDDTEGEECYENPCPSDGGWAVLTEWSGCNNRSCEPNQSEIHWCNWSPCNIECGGGMCKRIAAQRPAVTIGIQGLVTVVARAAIFLPMRLS